MSSLRTRRSTGAAEPVEEKRGLNRIPSWLRKDLGLSDWIAGSIVIVAGGLLLVVLFYLLILIVPAG